MLFRLFLNILIFHSIFSKNIGKSCTIDNDLKAYTTSGRIPTFAKPINYYISYEFDVNLNSYIGNVLIEVHVLDNTDFLILHSDWNEIESIFVSKKKDVIDNFYRTIFSEFCFVYENQYLVLKLSEFFCCNDTLKISIFFKAIISEGLSGIYSSYYKINDLIQKKVVSTQFEPISARMAFPCFDEPILKAVFFLELIVPKTYKVLSNSEISSQMIKDDSKILVRFFPTLKMSTYLLAFVIHEYESMSTTTKSGKRISIWLSSANLDNGKFALAMAQKVVDFNENLFKIKYQLSKIDLIGIPSFNAGAMENWGLITFRMTDLLVNENSASLDTRIRVAQVVAHEIAHQWFGNLVTMKWWSDVWLNEGFATFMELYCVEKIHPEYQTTNQLAFIKLEAMEYDQMATAHALSIKSNVLKNINALFEPISYKKGASILYMLFTIIGENEFFKCVEIYLTKFSFSNADSTDFWLVFKEKTKNDKYYEMMMTWTNNIGFPLVTVNIEKSSNIVKISQERMLLSQSDKFTIDTKYTDEDKSIWIVSISYIKKSDPDVVRNLWLQNKTNNIPISKSDSWIKINNLFSNYYRSDYDSEIFIEISKSLKNHPTIFSTMDKMSLISDIFTMVKLGRHSIDIALDHFEYIRNENNIDILLLFFGCMKIIKKFISQEKDLTDRFNQHVLGFSNPILTKLGWNHYEDVFKRQLQTLAISINVFFDHDETIIKAADLFKEHIKSKNNIEDNLLLPLVCAYIKNTNKAGFEEISSLYKSSVDPIMTRIYLSSLSCTKNVKLLESLLNLTLTEDINLQDRSTVVREIFNNPISISFAFDFLFKNKNKILKIYKNRIDSVAQIYMGLISSLRTNEDLKKITLFYKDNSFDLENFDVKFSIECIKNNIYLIKNIVPQLINYFKQI